MNSTFIQKFESTAKILPNNIALIAENHSTTYAQLHQMAKCIAVSIHTEMNANVEGIVLCLQRSESLIAIILACHYLGVPYIPIDPRTTKEKIDKILSQSRYLYISNVHKSTRQKTYCVTEILNASSQFDPEAMARSSKEAYRIYTSGSTGEPKGVMISHVGCSNLLEHFCSLLESKPEHTWLSSTSISFDIFFLEYSIPLSSGGTLILLTDNQIALPQQVASQLMYWSPSVYQATPSMFKGLLAYLDKSWRFQNILVGGEALSQQLSSLLFEKSDWLCNVYGPTETTVWSSAHVIKQGGDIRIGKAIRHTQLLVLNERQQACYPEESGRIHISGDGLAMGYFNNPLLTAKKFIDVSINGQSQKVYDTDDVGYIDDEGIVNFLHRDGGFIKNNGYRIEPCEITDVFESIEGVTGSAVIQIHDKISNSSKLIGWVECSCMTEVDFRSKLESKLSHYLIPHHIFTTLKLPYTLNGKVDLNTLKAMSLVQLTGSTSSVDTTPREGLELSSHPAGKILGRYLDITLMSKGDNFFERGLTSMQAISLHVDMLDLYPSLELHELFERPSFEALIAQFESE